MNRILIVFYLIMFAVLAGCTSDSKDEPSGTQGEYTKEENSYQEVEERLYSLDDPIFHQYRVYNDSLRIAAIQDGSLNSSE